MNEEVMAAEDMLFAIRRLHRSYRPNYFEGYFGEYGGSCRHCSLDIAENSMAISHPCPTLLAVDPMARKYQSKYWRWYSRFSDEPKEVLYSDFFIEKEEENIHLDRIEAIEKEEHERFLLTQKELK